MVMIGKELAERHERQLRQQFARFVKNRSLNLWEIAEVAKMLAHAENIGRLKRIVVEQSQRENA
jgi:hypothetical protein